MEISIIGYRAHLRDELEAQLRMFLGDNCPIALRQYPIEPSDCRADKPEDAIAAFVVIDEVWAINAAEQAVHWAEDFPVVMAATHPQYAIEAIRMKARHYILFPLEQAEIGEALRRAGVIL